MKLSRVAKGLVLFVAAGALAAPPAGDHPAGLAVPDAAALAKKEKLVRDVFGNYTATPLANRSAIAAKMIEQGTASVDDPAARYVLLKDGADLASSAGDAATALHAASLIGGSYAVDAAELKLANLRRSVTAASSPTLAEADAQQGITCADEAAAAGNYDLAGRYLVPTEQAARASKDVNLILAVQARSADVRWIQSETSRARTAVDKLAKTPGDPEANQMLGRYLCLVHGDWSHGLVNLSKGPAGAYRAAASADLANPTTTDKQVSAGDLWWDLAEKDSSAAAQRGLRRRAGHWYALSLASPQFVGLTRAVVEKRMSQIPPTPGDTVAGVPAAQPNPTTPQPAPAAPAVGSNTQLPSLTNSIGMKFVAIPAGEFDMGSPTTEQGRFESEKLHHVKITKPFMMATTTVTQAQWIALMGSNPSYFRAGKEGSNTPRAKDFTDKQDNLPAEQISWNDAVQFCEKLSVKEGRHYRLPTEAEWEYACRAGTATRYGDGSLDDVAWYAANSGNRVHDVAARKPNRWGLYDMLGNVWQWCSDGWGTYDGDGVDPKGSDDGAFRVNRGGSWTADPSNCRAAMRRKFAPGNRNFDVAFRVCLDSGSSAATPVATPATPAVSSPIAAYTNSISMRFMRVEPGEFDMGSPTTEQGRFDGETLHHVKITKPFLMGSTLVTQGQWKAIMGKNPAGTRGDDLPVVEVSWQDASAFCEQLSAKEGKHYRLPSEAEWEFACRAGTQTPFSFGDGDINDFAWHKANSQGQIHAVATKKPNRWGLFDMQGNVFQFCSDGFGPYEGDSTDPKGNEQNPLRVIRGGSYQNPAEYCRAACRKSFPRAERGGHIGFRVCLNIDEGPAAGRTPTVATQTPPANTAPRPGGNIFTDAPPAPAPAPAPTPAPSPAPDVPLDATWVNLLKSLDVQHNIVSGEWELDGGVLSAKPAQRAKVKIPVTPDKAYELYVEYRALPGGINGEAGIGIYLPVADSQVVLMVAKPYMGLDMVNGKPWGQNDALVHGTFGGDNKKHVVQIAVWPDKTQTRIIVHFDGKPTVDWTGTSQAVKIYGPSALPAPNSLGLLTMSVPYVITKFSQRDLGSAPPAK